MPVPLFVLCEIKEADFPFLISDFSFGHLRTTARLRYVCYGCQLESGIFRQWPNEKFEMRNGKSSSAPVSSTHAP
jgi:hypothetical protein